MTSTTPESDKRVAKPAAAKGGPRSTAKTMAKSTSANLPAKTVAAKPPDKKKSESSFERFKRSPTGRNVLYNVPHKLGRGALKIGLPAASLGLMRIPRSHYAEDQKTLLLREQAHRARGDEDVARKCQTTRLRMRIHPAVTKRNFPEVLRIMAELERIEQAAPFVAGRLIAQQIISEAGRARLLEAAVTAQEKFPDSAFLLHLITLCEAKSGNYQKANDLLLDRVNALEARTDRLSKLRFNLLQTSWRVVDLEAREQMDWANAGGGYQVLFDGNMPDAADKDTTPAEKPKEPAETPGAKARKPNVGKQKKAAAAIAVQDNVPPALGPSFKEHALQGRMRDEYLAACEAELAAAGSPAERLLALRAMTRPGVRHIPDYGPSFDLARKRLEENEKALSWLLGDEASEKTIVGQTVVDLCAWLHLTCKHKLDAMTRRIIERLDTLSQDKALGFALWPAPVAILRETGDDATAARIMGRIRHNAPKVNRDTQHYFNWAMVARRYSDAETFYKQLPKNLHRRPGLLYYVNILQRRGRFSEALRLLQDVHGQSLANPARVNAYTNHSLIKRTGELRFLIETATLYKSVKQPSKPKGVVLIAPRNIDHLRRYPLMVLLEFKRRGWAVVPLVEGLLPREQTGDRAIDVMNGAISPNIVLTRTAAAVMPDVEGFVSEPATGSLRWGNIDLSHSVWEDSAINRRRYSLDYSCPELQTYLGTLADWTRAVARVVAYARGQHVLTGRKTALVSLFNYRLPDALFRFYCEEFGDPDKFFYLHTANGYQNYFTNFSTNVSQRLVMRNMTRHPHVRSASFPLPEFFGPYYDEQRGKLPEIMERFAAITKVKRSTEGSQARPPEAEEVDKRIAAWRKKGGKVVCAFGKVVCDSGVPFDGGPAHASMKDWINHCIRTVQGTDTLLLIKPHPHELNNQIATFPTEYFDDLIEEPLGKNAIFLGHRWFDMHDMQDRMDLGLIYNGTTAVELGIMGIPSVLAGYFAPIDYPVGHVVPEDRADFERYLRFEKEAKVAPDLRERSAVWLDYMANEDFTQSYRYHARPVTNKVLYPPYWFKEDLNKFKGKKDPSVTELIGRALGEMLEPGGVRALTLQKEAAA